MGNPGRHMKEAPSGSVSDKFAAGTPMQDSYEQQKLEKKRRRNKIISNLLIAVGIICLLVAGGMYAKIQYDYAKQDQGMKELEAYAKVSSEAEHKPPVVDWEGLWKINKDAVAWIQIPGTVINYPVYQGRDNDQYLRHLADGSYGVGGLIFLDSENKKPGMIDQQTIIYGHHMKNGAMFKRIADMDQQELFDAVTTIWYVTPEKAYELKPLFLYYTTADDKQVRIFDFESEEAFHDYLMERYKKAVTKSKTAVEDIDKAEHVLTMSTCNYIEGSHRTELVCGIKNVIDLKK